MGFCFFSLFFRLFLFLFSFFFFFFAFSLVFQPSSPVRSYFLQLPVFNAMDAVEARYIHAYILYSSSKKARGELPRSLLIYLSYYVEYLPRPASPRPSPPHFCISTTLSYLVTFSALKAFQYLFLSCCYHIQKKFFFLLYIGILQSTELCTA